LFTTPLLFQLENLFFILFLNFYFFLRFFFRTLFLVELFLENKKKRFIPSNDNLFFPKKFRPKKKNIFLEKISKLSVLKNRHFQFCPPISIGSGTLPSLPIHGIIHKNLQNIFLGLTWHCYTVILRFLTQSLFCSGKVKMGISNQCQKKWNIGGNTESTGPLACSHNDFDPMFLSQKSSTTILYSRKKNKGYREREGVIYFTTIWPQIVLGKFWRAGG
jgi:hypothetical protein